MKDVLKNIIKNGVIMFAVGAALALISGPMANLLGGAIDADTLKHATNTNVLWTGAFFGAFGAIHSAVGPAMEWAFGGKEKDGHHKEHHKEKEHGKSAEPALEQAKSVEKPSITIRFQPDAPELEEQTTKHRDRYKAERVVLMQQTHNLPS